MKHAAMNRLSLRFRAPFADTRGMRRIIPGLVATCSLLAPLIPTAPAGAQSGPGAGAGSGFLSGPPRRPTTSRATTAPSTTRPATTSTSTSTTSATTRPSTTTSPTTTSTSTSTSSATTRPPSPSAGCGGCWVPPVKTSWQIQFSGTLDTTVDATLFDVDGFDTMAATVAALHTNGRKVACYLSAGTYEDWRPDAASYPSSILGNALADWPGERWVDVRDVTRPQSALAAILRARIAMCATKGFDALDFDNVDGYANSPGFPFTAADQLTFNRWLAAEGHAQRMSVALKNDLDQIPQLVSSFDWAVNEQCQQYGECDLLLPFVSAGKAVMQIEYSGASTAFCPSANARDFNAIKKRTSLDAYRVACR